MTRLRPIVRSVLCCLLCLIVCAAPALAANDQYTDGFIYPESGLVINYSSGSNSLDVLSGYFPASFGSEAINSIGSYGRNMAVVGKGLPHPDGTYNYTLTTSSQFYIEVLFSVPAPLSFDLVNNPAGKTGAVYAKIGAGNASNLTGFSGSRYAADMAFVTDGNLQPLTVSSGDYFTPAFGSYDIKHYYGYRFYFNPLNISDVYDGNIAMKLAWVENNLTYNFSDPNYVQGIYDEVTVNTGVLQEINGTLTDIKTSTSVIQQDVSEIKDGLQDSNSGIWGAFKDSLSGLLVPSAEDLTGVKDGFDQLAQDKLGGASQTVGMVLGGVQSVTDKFKNPGSSPGVEFPGISVPLGGDVGTVTLAASQTVTIPEQITDVLYPVAGIIIPIVCTIWTVRLGLDMVNCFMSGMSYGDFLHRHTDEEDNEV